MLIHLRLPLPLSSRAQFILLALHGANPLPCCHDMFGWAVLEMLALVESCMTELFGGYLLLSAKGLKFGVGVVWALRSAGIVKSRTLDPRDPR